MSWPRFPHRPLSRKPRDEQPSLPRSDHLAHWPPLSQSAQRQGIWWPKVTFLHQTEEENRRALQGKLPRISFVPLRTRGKAGASEQRAPGTKEVDRALGERWPSSRSQHTWRSGHGV